MFTWGHPAVYTISPGFWDEVDLSGRYVDIAACGIVDHESKLYKKFSSISYDKGFIRAYSAPSSFATNVEMSAFTLSEASGVFTKSLLSSWGHTVNVAKSNLARIKNILPEDEYRKKNII